MGQDHLKGQVRGKTLNGEGRLFGSQNTVLVYFDTDIKNAKILVLVLVGSIHRVKKKKVISTFIGGVNLVGQFFNLQQKLSSIINVNELHFINVIARHVNTDLCH